MPVTATQIAELIQAPAAARARAAELVGQAQAQAVRAAGEARANTAGILGTTAGDLVGVYQKHKADQVSKQEHAIVANVLHDVLNPEDGTYDVTKLEAVARQRGLNPDHLEPLRKFVDERNTAVLGQMKARADLKPKLTERDPTKDIIDPTGKVITPGTPKKADPFTLNPGDVRYDGDGKVIVKGADKAATPDSRSIDVQAAEALAKGDMVAYNRFLKAKKDLEAAGRAPKDGVPAWALQPAEPPTDGASRNEAYLTRLPPPVAAQVKAIVEGRRSLDPRVVSTPYGKQLLDAAYTYDPSFDQVNYNSRFKTRADFTSGKSSDQIRSLNTVIGHLEQLSDAADALHNRNFKTYNQITNAIMDEFGWTGKNDFNTIAPKVAQELTRVWRGTGGSEADIQRDIDAIANKNAPGQLHSSIAHLGGLLESQLDSMKEKYRQGMGTTDVEMIAPKSRAVLTKLEQRGTGKAATGATDAAPLRKPIPGIPGAEAESTDGGVTWKRTK